jgi:hypothetical protein
VLVVVVLPLEEVVVVVVVVVVAAAAGGERAWQRQHEKQKGLAVVVGLATCAVSGSSCGPRRRWMRQTLLRPRQRR